MSPHLQHISNASTITYRMPHTSAMGRVMSAMMPQMMNEMGLQATIATGAQWRWKEGEAVWGGAEGQVESAR